MKHYLVYLRDNPVPTEIPVSQAYVIQGNCYVFYIPGEKKPTSFPVYLVQDIVEVE